MSASEKEHIPKAVDAAQRNPYHAEAFSQKVYRKTVANPLVPFGVALTTAALLGGLRAFTKGNVRKSNLFMRYRVAAQGFTVVVLLGGTFWTAVNAQK